MGESGSPLAVDVKRTIQLRDPELQAYVDEGGRRLLTQQSASPATSDGLFLEETSDYTIEDLLPLVRAIDSSAALASQQDWQAQLAFYRSPRCMAPTSSGSNRDWGIYLHAGGVEHLAAEVYLPAGFSHARAIGYAAADLINHEMEHAIFDLTAIHIEAAVGPQPGLGAHTCHPCLMEEALSHAAVYRGARSREGAVQGLTSSQLVSTRRRLEAWLSAGPAGYRDWRSYESDNTAVSESARLEVLTHDGVSYLIGPGVRTQVVGSTLTWRDVPLHLIETAGSAASSGHWQFA
ncbi:hypothetical protein ASG74_14320 [Knoellia sp. Soil729]|nr:hypothetical protein ASG74_14320 [Knoellia sp. Soil729]